MKVWALAMLFVCDMALPMAPGAFQFAGQSVEVARRLSVQTEAAVPLPALQPQFLASNSPTLDARVREACEERVVVRPRRPFDVPLVRSPQVETEAAALEDPA